MAAPDLRTAVRNGAAHLERDGRASSPRSSATGGSPSPRYADLQHRFDVLGGYTLDQRVDAALSGLGFARDEWAKPPTALSGGEQTRAALARLVIADPDLLLLDEPTNHLDLDALEWLEEHLRRRAGSLLVASHDRAFLDATVTRVWELRDRRLTAFRGDYSAYHRQREERDARAAQGRRDPGRGDRPRAGARPALPEPPQVQQDARARGPPRAAPGRAARGAEDRAASWRCRRRRWPAAAPSRSGEIVVRVEDLAVGYLPGRGALDADGEPATRAAGSWRASRSSPPSAATGSGSSGRTARARRRCCGRSPATCRRSTAR